MCTGSESVLTGCIHLGFNVTRSCDHNEDAGVRCCEGQGTDNYWCNYVLFSYLAMYIIMYVQLNKVATYVSTQLYNYMIFIHDS